ncbi:hypothetical protein [Hymenobacter sp. BRD67]|uniref:hypothetical protein n=1 Tax=Hymenobacter sp. BRD67 TaxID=2675877 RepID=UPI0015675F6C|nr:hypothetical protein [Hymenobacter sp. BRD67]QKG51808.1 hypothetical protein GKZ67_03325 [Hymenobacter sp. BRD67]
MNAEPKLARPQSEVDFLELRYRPDVQLLVARWRRPVSAAELQQGYRATLQLAQEVGCPFWQIDIRSRNAPDEATQRWLTTEFLERATQQLNGPVCLGYLLTPTLLAELSGPGAGSSQIGFFAEEGALTAWLTQCQHSRLGQAQPDFNSQRVA